MTTDRISNEQPDYLPISMLNQLEYCERRFWFQMDEDELLGRSEQLLKLKGWEVVLNAPYGVEQISRALERRPLITWHVQMAPWDLAYGYNLAALFQVYLLRPVAITGRSTIGDEFWSVAFGLNAFLLSTVYKASSAPLIV